jgi:hypothetical protein
VLAQDRLESPLVLTPTDLELRAEPTVAISVHDKSRLQWTATVPLAGDDYELSVELEIPLRIDAPHAPWAQLQEYARLDEPRAGTRAQAALEALRSSTVSVALRLARASEGFTRHCDLALRRAAEVDPSALDTGLSVWPELARRTVAEARGEFLAPSDRCAPEIEAERALAAEWISNEMVRFLTQASHSLMRVTARPIVETYPFSAIIRSAEEQIFQMLEVESAWRRTHDVPAFDGSSAELERYQERASLLKKHFQQQLFLDPDIVQVEQRAHNWAAALAALVASSWAFAWQLLLAHRTSALATAGSGVLVLAVVTGVVYVFKDRLKELGREWLSGRLRRAFGHRILRYRVPGALDGERAPVLVARESFVQTRGSAPDPLGSPDGVPVSIVRFEQRGRPGRELPTLHATQVRIGFRYDLSPLFSRMHDLAKPVAVADAGTRRIRFLNSPRSYRVGVRVRLRCGGTVREETASLVMNKQGLQRLESAPIH